MSTYAFDVVHILRSGGLVFIERVERVLTPDGRRLVLPFIGVFELNAQLKITAWRDYWDPSMITRKPA